jgi:hypothetical protein
LLGAVVVAAAGLAFIPAGGGAAPTVANSQRYDGVIKQGATETTTLTATGCASTGPGAPGTGTVSNVFVRTVAVANGGGDTGGNSQNLTTQIRVFRSGSQIATITEHAIDVAVASFTVPCNIVGTATTQSFTFVPYKANGTAQGNSSPATDTVAVGFAGPGSPG